MMDRLETSLVASGAYSLRRQGVFSWATGVVAIYFGNLHGGVMLGICIRLNQASRSDEFLCYVSTSLARRQGGEMV